MQKVVDNASRRCYCDLVTDAECVVIHEVPHELAVSTESAVGFVVGFQYLAACPKRKHASKVFLSPRPPARRLRLCTTSQLTIGR